jgi:glycolate oxidase iron-sulfur subunit
VLHDFRKLATYARFIRLYQRSGLQKILRATGLLKLMRVSDLDALSPAIERDFYFREIGTVHPAIGECRGRVALLAGCVASVAFAELNRATVRVLTKNGIEVIVPTGQTCCGALHAHSGYLQKARELAKKNIDALLGPGIDAVLSNAAGCGSMMKDYGEWLEHDAEYGEKATRFASSVRDVNEYLAEVGLRAPVRRLSARVTYQDPCHLAHGQRIRNAPRELLKAVGLEVIEMPRADDCCGSAGTYNVTQNELSMKILDEKMANVATVQPEVIATANVGCMLQLRAGAERAGVHAEVAHVIELLDRAY